MTSWLVASEGESVEWLCPSFQQVADRLQSSCLGVIAAFIFRRASPFARVCVQTSCFYKDTSHMGLTGQPTAVGPRLNKLLCISPVSKRGPVLRPWGLGLQTMDLEGHSPTHNPRS